MSTMFTTHCGKKSMVYNVFKTLFVNTTSKPSSVLFGRRKISTTVLNIPAPQKVIDYNKLIKAQAKIFKKKEKGQQEASRILAEMKERGLEPNSQTYLQLVIGMAAQRHRNNIQNKRLESWFNELFKLESKKERKNSSADKMEKILYHLSLHGHPNLKNMFYKIVNLYSLDIAYWHMAMKGCIKSRKIDDAEELLNIARGKRIATMLSYKILIESYLYCKDLKSASRVFSLMLNDQVTANYQIYELFINYYMDQPFAPDNAETLNKLWQAVLMTTKEQKIIPDDIIQKYITYYGKNGELSRAEQLYLDIKSRKEQKLNRKCFGGMNKIIVGFSNKRQLPSALSLYYDMIGEGYKPSMYVFSKIVEACKAKNDIEAIQQLLNVTNELNPTAKMAQSLDSAIGSSSGKSLLLQDYNKKGNQ